MIISVTTLPPASTLIFDVEVDEFGNETFTGDYMIVGGEQVPPTYSTPPVPRTTVPYNPAPPGGRDLYEIVREGLNLREIDSQAAQIYPSEISQWQASEAARVLDGVHATTQAPSSGYSDALRLSTFDVSEVPDDAIITGIKVTVTRSKI